MLAIGDEKEQITKFDMTLSSGMRNPDSSYMLSRNTGGFSQAMALYKGKGEMGWEDESTQLLFADPVSLIVRTDDHCVEFKQFVENAGGHFGSRFGYICTAVVPYESLQEMAQLDSIVRVEASVEMKPELKRVRDNDVGVGLSAQGSVSNLSDYSKYDGKGVVVGIIDNGVDVSLPAFKDANGKSRIAYYWNQSGSKNSPSDFGYGSEYTASDINNGNAVENSIPVGSKGDHGTHVAGCAAGRDSNYPGIAPEAKIIVVQVGDSTWNLWRGQGDWSDVYSGSLRTTSTLLHAYKYIIDRSEKLGLPCVINQSSGTAMYGHDGSTLFEQALQEAVDNLNLISCKSAGNENGSNHVACGNNSVDFYILPFAFSTDNSGNITSIDHVIKKDDLYDLVLDLNKIDVYFSKKSNAITLDLSLIESGNKFDWPTILIDDVANFPGTLKQFQISNNKLIQKSWDGKSDPDYPFQLYIPSVEKIDANGIGNGNIDTYHLRLSFYSSDAHVFNFSLKSNNADTYYFLQRDGMNVFDSNSKVDKCSLTLPIVPGFITVGSYSIFKYDPIPNYGKDNPGEISWFSSLGPVRTGNNSGRFTGKNGIKPDIAAPGCAIISQRASNASFRSNEIYDSTHVYMGGTSMASPVTAGMVALLLQKWPNATAENIKTLLFDKAKQDSNTGSVPNNTWGHGKLNAASLTSTAISVPAPVIYAVKRVTGSSNKLAIIGKNFEREATAAIDGTSCTVTYCSNRKLIISGTKVTSSLINAISSSNTVSEEIGAGDIMTSQTTPPSSFTAMVTVTNPHASTSQNQASWGNASFSITKVESYENNAEELVITLSDSSITSGTCYINGLACNTSRNSSSGKFHIYNLNGNLPGELVSFVNEWTDTLSKDYTLKFILSNNQESAELTYHSSEHPLPVALSNPQIISIDADNDSSDRCQYAYVKTNGYGGALKINEITPEMVAWSSAKNAYRVKVPGELGRIILGTDNALSRYYVFTLTNSSDTVLSSYTFNAERSLQPVITSVDYTYADNKAYVYIKDCAMNAASNGNNAGNAIVKINDTVVSNQSYYSDVNPFFVVTVPSDLYTSLRENGCDGTTLAQTYRITVTSDEGITSRETIIGPDKPVIQSVVGCDAYHVYVLVSKANTWSSKINIDDINCTTCEYTPSKNTSTALAFKVNAPADLAAYKLGTVSTTGRKYACEIVYTRSDKNASAGFTVDAPAVTNPTITSVTTGGVATKAYVTVAYFTTDCLFKISVGNGTATTVSHTFDFIHNRFELDISSYPDLANYLSGTSIGLNNKHTVTYSSFLGDCSYSINPVAEINPSQPSEGSSYEVVTFNGTRYLKIIGTGLNGISEIKYNGTTYTVIKKSSTEVWVALPASVLDTIVNGASGSMSQTFTLYLYGFNGAKVTYAVTVQPATSVPSITGVTTGSTATKAYVYVTNASASGTVSASSGSFKIAAGSGTAATVSHTYNSTKGAFELDLSSYSSLANYLAGSSTGLDNKYTITYTRSDSKTCSWSKNSVAEINPSQPAAGENYEVVTSNGVRYLKITGTGLDVITEIKYNGTTYTVIKKSSTEVWVALPSSVLDVIVNGASGSTSQSFTLYLYGSNGGYATHTVTVQPSAPPSASFTITKVEKDSGYTTWLYITLSDASITSGKLYINNAATRSYYTSNYNGRFNFSGCSEEFVSFIQGWTDTLSKDYTLKFVAEDGRESAELVYRASDHPVPAVVSNPQITSIEADTDSNSSKQYQYAYVKTNGYGGTLKINGTAPSMLAWSSAKNSYRVSVPFELGRKLLGTDGALSRDYVFTLVNNSGTVLSSYTVSAVRNLQPVITSVSNYSSTDYAYVYVRDCAVSTNGTSAGNAIVKINGTAVSGQIYYYSDSSAYFTVPVSSELYACLKDNGGDGTTLSQTYRFTVTSDEGVTSREHIISPEKPVIQNVLGCDANNVYVLVSKANASGSKIAIDGTNCTACVYTPSQNTSTALCFKVNAPSEFAAYKLGTSSTLSKSYSIVYTRSDKNTSDAFSVVPVAVPSITSVTTGSTATKAYVYVTNASVSGTVSASSGYFTMTVGSGTPSSLGYSYNSTKGAFEINLAGYSTDYSSLINYLAGTSTGLDNKYTITYKRSDSKTCSWSKNSVAEINPSQPEAGSSYEVVTSSGTRYLKITGTGLDGITEIKYNGTSYTVIKKSSTEVWVALPASVLDTIVNGASGSTSQTFTLYLYGANGAYATHAVTVQPSAPPPASFTITKVEKLFDNNATIILVSLSDSSISSGTCYINNKSCYTTDWDTRFYVSATDYPELVSFIQGWTDTLSKDYALKFVSEDGRESEILTYSVADHPLPGIVSTSKISSIANAATNNYAYVYMTNGYGGALKINGETPAFVAWSSAKGAYLATVSYELVRKLKGTDNALSRDYVFTTVNASGTVTATKTLSAERSLQPVITSVSNYYSDNKAYVYVRDCAVSAASNGNSAGNAIVKINGTAVSSQSYSSGSAYFTVPVSSDLYDCLKNNGGDGTTLSQTYRITVTSDEGITSKEHIIGPEKPVIQSVTGCDANNVYVLVSKANAEGSKISINGTNCTTCVYTPSQNTSAALCFKVSAPAELAAYKLGTASAMSKDYSIVYTRSDKNTSEAFSVAPVAVPSITSVTTGSTATKAYVYVTNASVSGTVSASSGHFTMTVGSGTPSSLGYSYNSTKGAFEINLAGYSTDYSSLINYLAGTSTGLDNKYTITYTRGVDKITCSWSINAVAEINPSQPADGENFEVVTSNGVRYLKITGTGLDGISEIKYNGTTYTVIKKSSTEVWVALPASVLDVIVNGASGSSSVTYTLYLYGSNGAYATHTVTVQPATSALAITKVESWNRIDGELLVTLSKSDISNGTMYINGSSCRTYPSGSKFHVFVENVNDFELVSFVNGWTETLSKDYALKFVAEDGTESDVLTYKAADHPLPAIVSGAKITGLYADDDASGTVSCAYAYVKTTGYGGPLKINGKAPYIAAWSSSKHGGSYRVKIAGELGRKLLGYDGILSRDYVFTIENASGTVIDTYTEKAVRNLTPVITKITASSTENKANVFIKDCAVDAASNGDGAGNAIVKINGAAVSFGYLYSFTNAYFCNVTIPSDLYACLKNGGDGTTLSQTYRFTVTSDEGLTSREHIIGPEKPVIENILGCDANFVYVLVSKANSSNSKIAIDGTDCMTCVYTPSRNTATALCFKVNAPSELGAYMLGTSSTLSKSYPVVYTRSDKNASNTFTVTLATGTTPSITSVTTGSTATKAYVTVANASASGAVSASSGSFKIARGTGTAATVSHTYNSTKGAFELNLSSYSSLANYLAGSSTGLDNKYTITYTRSDSKTCSWSKNSVAEINPSQPAAGENYEVVTSSGVRYLKITGTGLDGISEIKYNGTTYTVIKKSSTEVWVSLPSSVLDVIVNGASGSTSQTYTLYLYGSNGAYATHTVTVQPASAPSSFTITKVEKDSSWQRYIYITLSDSSITKGKLYINNSSFGNVTASSGKFNIYTSQYEFVSFIQGWTDTLSKDYTLKFVAEDGRESAELVYRASDHPVPAIISNPKITSIEADTDTYSSYRYEYAYVKTNGYGGTLKINGSVPSMAAWSSSKNAYRVSVPAELGRKLLGTDGALSRDYVFTLVNNSGTFLASYTVSAVRNLQPIITSVIKSYSTDKALVYVRDCVVSGTSSIQYDAGNAIVKINGTAVSSQSYSSSSSAYFTVPVPSDLYAYLKDGTLLTQEYSITVTSDEGITSEAMVFKPETVKPVITSITGDSIYYASLHLTNFTGGEVFINGYPAEGYYDADEQVYHVKLNDDALGNYLMGKTKSLADNYVFRVKTDDGAISDPYTISKVTLVKPTIKKIEKYSSTSTSYAYVYVTGCTKGSVYIDGTKRTSSYVSSKGAFKVSVTSEIGKYLSGKSKMLPNDHVFKVVNQDDQSVTKTLKATVSKPVISKITNYSSTSTSYAYVYCSNCKSGTVYLNGSKRTATYVSSKKAFKVSIPAELGKYLTGKSKFLAKSYSFKVVNQNGSISAVKTIAAVPNVPKITSVGKYLSTYVYVYVKNCASSAKVYVNGKVATSSYVSSKNAFKVKVPSALGNYLKGTVKTLNDDYKFKVVSSGKTSAIYTVKKVLAAPVITSVVCKTTGTADIYANNVITGGNVYVNGNWCGSSYKSGTKAFVGVNIPEELGYYLKGYRQTLSKDYKITVKTSEGKTSAAFTFKANFPEEAPAIAQIMPDNDSWIKIYVKNCASGTVYIDGVAVPTVCSVPNYYSQDDGIFYAWVDNEIANVLNGTQDHLGSSHTIKVKRGDGISNSVLVEAGVTKIDITGVGLEEYVASGEELYPEEAELSESAIEAAEDFIAARKEQVLHGIAIDDSEITELDPEVEADAEETIYAEDDYVEDADMTEEEEDEYVLRTAEDPSGLMEDGDEVEFPEDFALSLNAESIDASLIPQIDAIHPVKEYDDALAVFGHGFSDNCAALIDGEFYASDVNDGHCLVLRGIPAETIELLLNGESGDLQVISHIFVDGELKDIPSFDDIRELVSDELVSLAEMGLMEKEAAAASASVGSGAPQASGGYCFIATAAYGTYMEPQVMVLRQFRDEHLMTCAPGRAFVKLYYANSPAVANYIAVRPWARSLTRAALTPVVLAVEHPSLGLVLILLLAGSAVRCRRRQ